MPLARLHEEASDESSVYSARPKTGTPFSSSTREGLRWVELTVRRGGRISRVFEGGRVERHIAEVIDALVAGSEASRS